MNLPPDLRTGPCFTHPEPWIWDADTSTAGDAAVQAPSLLTNATVAEAKRLCRQCPVKQPCLEWTMATEGGDVRRSTVAGGLTARERNKLAKGKPLPPHGSEARYRLELQNGAACQQCKDASAESRTKSRVRLREARQGHIAQPSDVRRAS